MKTVFWVILIISAIMNNPDIIIKDGGVNTDYEEATELINGELK